jgi:hypothetical protein
MAVAAELEGRAASAGADDPSDAVDEPVACHPELGDVLARWQRSLADESAGAASCPRARRGRPALVSWHAAHR